MGGFDFEGIPQQYPQQLPMPQMPQLPEGNAMLPLAGHMPTQNPSNTYAAANAPTLPPIRVPDRTRDDYQQFPRTKRAPTATQTKEEKVGGVTAHLDYNMEEMVDFVSEMAQGMYGIFVSKICLADIDMTRSVLNSTTTVHPAFRKFVSQVLTSTRLPSSTILLGMHYLAIRMTILSARRDYSFSGGDVYSMLTTALLLGSKFLDDNTFQNKSWSDVSNIPVKKLNVLETEWLRDIHWDLHFDPLDPKGFALWRRRWQSHQTKKIDSLAESMKQACLDSRLPRQSSIRQSTSPNHSYPSAYSETPVQSYHNERPAQQWQPSHYESWASTRSHDQYSPPSAPETGPTTPENPMAYDFGYGPLPPALPSLKMPPPMQMMPSTVPQSGYMTPYTPQSHHFAAFNKYCNCQYCMPNGDHYSAGRHYGQQVVG